MGNTAFQKSSIATPVAINKGGTNSTTALNSNRIMTSQSGAIKEAGAMGDGKLLIGSTGSAPVVANIIAGANVTVTNGPGSIEIAAGGSITYKNGSTTYDVATASGTQNIAHGLGKTPLKVRLSANLTQSNDDFEISNGAFDGTTNSVTALGLSVAGASYAVSNSTNAIYIGSEGGTSSRATGIVTVDATNIIITWTKTSTPTGTAQIMWEVEG